MDTLHLSWAAFTFLPLIERCKYTHHLRQWTTYWRAVSAVKGGRGGKRFVWLDIVRSDLMYVNLLFCSVYVMGLFDHLRL